MPFKATNPPSRYVEVDRWPGGVGWFAYPDETMARTSHALRIPRNKTGDNADTGSDADTATDTDTATDADTANDADDELSSTDEPADVWLIDPLRAPGIEGLLDEMGPVVGVVVLLDRHERDAARFAKRYDVPLYVPTWIDIEIPTGVRRVDINTGLPGTDYELLRTVDMPGWHEAALTDGETLVVADAVGTVDYFRTGTERLGVHPFLRFMPPRVLANERPERILTGHGPGITNGAPSALQNAFSGTRRRIPRLYAGIAKSAVTRRFSSAD